MSNRRAASRVPEMSWFAWGDPSRAEPLSDSVRALIAEALGAELRDLPPVAESEVRLPPSALGGEARTAITAALGGDAGRLRTDDAARLRRSAGKSTPDLLRMRAGAVSEAPDAVLLPAGHDQVEAVLRACSEQGVAVVPFGGGTSVVGGVAPLRGRFSAVVALDLRELDALVSLDEESRTAVLQAGLRAPEAEELLAERGYTLGHLPQSYEYATIGGFAATRSSGQASAGYGRFDDMVVALKAATPRGTLEAGRAPSSAAGPDLRQLLLGSEGVFGVITEVTVRVRPIPRARHDEAWAFPSFAEGAAALRALAQSELRPTTARLSDETETFVNAALSGKQAAPGCLVVVGFDGEAGEVEARRAATAAALTEAGGSALGSEPVADWRHSRFHAPYLRDTLLSAGILAETLETAASWSGLLPLYRAVGSAVSGALEGPEGKAVVLCHVSHTYPEGASLYFTVVTAAGAAPAARWERAKRAAGDAIAAAGGTITHHHAVGTDHRPWMPAEIGPLGAEALRAVKSALDPAGILNPGKLIPEAE
ncbi:FAD-binding oxidoreductase [Nocardiopsis composta]|uniref:Alkyldihydroxyacetonephosphate synthase n=1 Tax=Nocardiopsis composta TaxID=157465 RepID=A0A7W8QLN3_9ACTN|nr:FAD-binding oxidoreductase [Nocardiopsis composta]MBB5432737.1 alkyldihydroxyacetonephosphate synthase [Nocardiopsis composta]